MSGKHGTGYTLGFAAAVCLVCSVFVCVSAVALKEKQEQNKKLDEQKNVLAAAGLIEPGQALSNQEVGELFKAIKPVVVDLKTGAIKDDVKADQVNMRLALSKPDKSYAAPPNKAKIVRLPNEALVYELLDGDRVTALILPISGKGLWSTIYGFLALDVDTTTVKGVSFYEHGETPGLGGEVQNPKWTALWKGRKVLDDQFAPVFGVKKGPAGSVADDPNHVDGLSGATLTSKGVTELVKFWTGEDGFGPFLANFRKGVK